MGEGVLRQQLRVEGSQFSQVGQLVAGGAAVGQGLAEHAAAIAQLHFLSQHHAADLGAVPADPALQIEVGRFRSLHLHSGPGGKGVFFPGPGPGQQGLNGFRVGRLQKHPGRAHQQQGSQSENGEKAVFHGLSSRD